MHLGFSLLTLVPGRMGGSESYVRALLDQFSDGRGPEQVTVLVNRDGLDQLADAVRGPVSLHPIPGYRTGRGTAARVGAIVAGYALRRRLARDLPADLDLIHYPVTIPIPASSRPAVVTLHDVQHHDLPSFFSRAERALRTLTYDRAAKEATLVLTPSAYSAGRIEEVLGLPADRIRVVASGVDQRFDQGPVASDAERLAALGLERPFVLYPANLWPHKNHDRLIDAFARVSVPDLELVLTGMTYSHAARIAERARAAGTAERVRHLGYVDRDAMPAMYRAARALVFPSLYEGFGGPPLEAMASGCPVASSTRASLAELVTGACVELDPESTESIVAGIERVTTDEALREQLVAAGLERARSFSWENSARGHVAAYARALEAGTTSAS